MGEKLYPIEVLMTGRGEFDKGDFTPFHHVDWGSDKFRDRLEVLSRLGIGLERIQLPISMTVLIGATRKDTGIIFKKIGGIVFSRSDTSDVYWFSLCTSDGDIMGMALEEIKDRFFLKFKVFSDGLSNYLGEKERILDKRRLLLIQKSIVLKSLCLEDSCCSS